MKSKYSAPVLKRLALQGAIAGREARAFAAYHDSTLNDTNHLDYVEAFIIQLGAPPQHDTIQLLLASCERWPR